MIRGLIAVIVGVGLTVNVAHADPWKGQKKWAEKYWKQQRNARENDSERAEEYWEEQRERAEELRERQREAYEDYLDDLEDYWDDRNDGRRTFQPTPRPPVYFYRGYPRLYYFPTPSPFDHRFYQNDD